MGPVTAAGDFKQGRVTIGSNLECTTDPNVAPFFTNNNLCLRTGGGTAFTCTVSGRMIYLFPFYKKIKLFLFLSVKIAKIPTRLYTGWHRRSSSHQYSRWQTRITGYLDPSRNQQLYSESSGYSNYLKNMTTFVFFQVTNEFFWFNFERCWLHR